MKTLRKLLWLIPLILLLLILPFIVPSAVMSPDAGAEESGVPVYTPVTLEHPDVEPLPMKPVAKYEPGMTPYAPDPDAFITDEEGNLTGYLDGTISVRTEERVLRGTRVLFTWVQLADASQFRTAMAGHYPQANETNPRVLAKTLMPVLAINGDWCVGHNYGVVIRNGKRLRKAGFGNYDSLIIDYEGNFHILKAPKMSEFDAYEGQVMHAFVFGPALVIDGEAQTYSDREGREMGASARHQRQALCQMGPLSYLIITTEGPEQSEDGGFTVNEIAQLAHDCGAVQAYNLDGGASVWVLLGDTRINNLESHNQRHITDLVYFVTAEPAQEKTAGTTGNPE